MTPDDRTIGDYATEGESAADLDRRLAATGWFRVYPEVTGFNLQPRFDTDLQGVRIDRVLIPTPKLLEARWGEGAIGIECKKSGDKAGRPISQMIDYGRAAFDLPPVHVRVMLKWVFLWPMSTLTGPAASVMHQQRIGVVHPFGDGIRFMVGGTGCLVYRSDWAPVVQSPAGGGKVGNRG